MTAWPCTGSSRPNTGCAQPTCSPTSPTSPAWPPRPPGRRDSPRCWSRSTPPKLRRRPPAGPQAARARPPAGLRRPLRRARHRRPRRQPRTSCWPQTRLPPAELLQLGHRLRVTHRTSILRYMYDLDVSFTNNQAERDLRPTKLHRKISGCFRSHHGAERFAHLRSYLPVGRRSVDAAPSDLNTYAAGQRDFRARDLRSVAASRSLSVRGGTLDHQRTRRPAQRYSERLPTVRPTAFGERIGDDGRERTTGRSTCGSRSATF